MGEWLAENWYVVLLLIIYVMERSPEVLKTLKQHAASKAASREAEKLFGDDGDAPATADDKKPRSKARKVVSGALHLLPFISRIKRMTGR